MVKAIIYRLKTGCQWREILIKQFFRVKCSWISIYAHYRKWCKDGGWEKLWQALLKEYKSSLDIASVELNGTHTPAKRGGEAVAYQGRKSARQVICLFSPILRVYQLLVVSQYLETIMMLLILQNFDSMITSLKDSNISISGLLLNTYAGSNTVPFRNCLFKHDIFDNIDNN
ncbi:MAG: transposase [Carboxylicivirga sp.]|nr:transposase [Carboxylicivirga sp.]